MPTLDLLDLEGLRMFEAYMAESRKIEAQLVEEERTLVERLRKVRECRARLSRFTQAAGAATFGRVRWYSGMTVQIQLEPSCTCGKDRECPVDTACGVICQCGETGCECPRPGKVQPVRSR